MSAKNKANPALEGEYEDILDDETEDSGEDSEGRGLSERKGRATPGRRAQEVEEEKSEGGFLSFIRSPFSTLGDYFEGVRSELGKVLWPTREEARRLATIVLIVCIIASIVLGAISLLFNALIVAGLESPTLIFGGIFLAVIVIFGFYLRNSNSRSSSF
ncbi:MAG: preprotein translocase subunit SecE [Anaerolineae bacterium]|nr:preprotein translocase subunit SecE [Anaerolineae bacterium]